MKLMHLLSRTAGALMLIGVSISTSTAADDLVVGVDTSFVPFEFEEDGEYVGFDIDMWDTIAEDIGVSYELRPMDFNGLIPALQTGNIDAAIAGMTIKAEREEVVDFSYPYYDSGLMLMVRSDNTEIKGPDDVKGKTIAVKTGTTGADYAATLDAEEVKQFPNISDAYLDLRAGRADVAMHDTPNVLYYIKTAGDGEVKAVGPNLDAQSYGIAFPQDSPLREKVTIALLRMMEDGRYAEIYRKWFGADPQ